MKLNHLAGDHDLHINVDATTISGTNIRVIGRAPFKCTVTGAYFLPTADMTGATTDNATLTILNKGSDGNGTTSVAALAFAAGVDFADFDQKAITLSTTAASLNLAEGDVLSVAWAKGGAGLVTPAGTAGVLLKAR